MLRAAATASRSASSLPTSDGARGSTAIATPNAQFGPRPTACRRREFVDRVRGETTTSNASPPGRASRIDSADRFDGYVAIGSLSERSMISAAPSASPSRDPVIRVAMAGILPWFATPPAKRTCSRGSHPAHCRARWIRGDCEMLFSSAAISAASARSRGRSFSACPWNARIRAGTRDNMLQYGARSRCHERTPPTFPALPTAGVELSQGVYALVFEGTSFCSLSLLLQSVRGEQPNFRSTTPRMRLGRSDGGESSRIAPSTNFSRPARGCRGDGSTGM